MSITTDRLEKAAERTEARSLTMLQKLKELAEGLIDFEDLLDLDKPRLADAVEGKDEPKKEEH